MSKCLSTKYNDELMRIAELKRNNQVSRLGVLFDTELNNYLYDSGTGKVLQLDDVAYEILKCLFDLNSSAEMFYETLTKYTDIEIENFVKSIIDEHLLSCPKMEKLYTANHYEHLEENVNNELRQVILEVTERCNLRCKYCIYNDGYSGNRSFGTKNMSWDVAKAAVDYANEHSNNEIAVTFYGGEPLLNFDVLRKTIDYAYKTIKNKKLSFSLTTNLTLMTKDIANYLASVEKLSVLCSIDGPSQVQNDNRKYANKKDTYDDVMIGLKNLVDAFKNNNTNAIAINSVFTPPYSYEKIIEINDFFNNLDFLPPNTNINISYASKGSIDDEAAIKKLYSNPKYSYNRGSIVNPLWVWQRKQAEIHSSIRSEKNNIYSSTIEKALIHIHNRIIYDEPYNAFPFNGCCIPGARRLYISTDGELYLCEKIGKSPSIGDIYNGIDFTSLRKNYVEDFSKQSTPFCSNCWASKMCASCYVDNYDQDGCNLSGKKDRCDGVRNMLKSYLSLYHDFLESYPDKLEFLKDIKIV